MSFTSAAFARLTPGGGINHDREPLLLTISDLCNGYVVRTEVSFIYCNMRANMICFQYFLL